MNEILELHKQDSPLPHLQESYAVKGDVVEELPLWLEDNPHAVIAMAIFDMDIYRPTKFALEALSDRFVEGSIVVFDEFSTKNFPGETRAVSEVLNLNMLKLERSPLAPTAAWFRWKSGILR